MYPKLKLPSTRKRKTSKRRGELIHGAVFVWQIICDLLETRILGRNTDNQCASPKTLPHSKGFLRPDDEGDGTFPRQAETTYNEGGPPGWAPPEYHT